LRLAVNLSVQLFIGHSQFSSVLAALNDRMISAEDRMEHCASFHLANNLPKE
jgi:hypothetical protein